ncbi:MAG: DnaJ domain-containing protein [Phycisphaerae bacterium]
MAEEAESSGVRGFLYWALPLAGFIFGYFVGDSYAGIAGGIALSLTLGVAAFTVLLFLDEQLSTKRNLHGFFLRNRGDIVGFSIAAVTMFIGAGIVAAIFGPGPIILGSIAGWWIGQWIGAYVTRQLRWSSECVSAGMEVLFAYAAVVVSAAQADGVVTDAERAEIADTCRRLFATFGFDDDDMITRAIGAAVDSQVSAQAAGGYVGTLSGDLQRAVFADVCRVLFSSGDLNAKTEEWILGFLATSGIEDTSLLHVYTRKYASCEDDRQKCLSELGLPPDATTDDIKHWYRKLALDYHPDRLGNVPPQIKALAEAKMMAVNQAYSRLMDGPHQEPTLYFQGTDGASYHAANRPNGVAKCWLCSQGNRVPSAAEPATARCGRCHALLGVTWDPSATA